jgi:mannosyltransferase OCH1-like enzyme
MISTTATWGLLIASVVVLAIVAGTFVGLYVNLYNTNNTTTADGKSTQQKKPPHHQAPSARTIPAIQVTASGSVDGHHRLPNKIMQTYKTRLLEKGMYDSVERVRQQNAATHTHVFLDDFDGTRFIDTNFDIEVSDTWDVLVAGAYKADLLRLCWLYVHGGCYIDVSMVPLMPISELLNHVLPADDNAIDLIVVWDTPSAPYAIYQAFLIASPRHPIIKRAIDDIVTDVANRTVVMDMLCLTGPDRFGRSLCAMLDQNPEDGYTLDKKSQIVGHENIMVLTHHDSGVWHGSTRLIQTKYDDWLEDRSDSTHYSVLSNVGNYYHVDSSLLLRGQHSRTAVHPTGVRATVPNGTFPRIVWQTWEHTYLPHTNVINGLMATQLHSHGFEYMFHDRHQRLAFFEQNFDARVVKAYTMVKPGAFRADMWRVGVLWVYGGVYLDIDAALQMSLTSLFDRLEAMSSDPLFWAGSIDASEDKFWNAFMAFKPKNPLLGQYLETIVQNILRQELPETDLHLTGPHCFSEVLSEYYDSSIGDLVVPGFTLHSCGPRYVFRYNYRMNAVHDLMLNDSDLEDENVRQLYSTCVARAKLHGYDAARSGVAVAAEYSNAAKTKGQLFVCADDDICTFKGVPSDASGPSGLTPANTVILLTTTVNVSTVDVLADTDASERLARYTASAQRWLNDGFKVVVVENSGFNGDLGITHYDQKNQFELLVIPPQVYASRINVLTLEQRRSKGQHESASIVYALEHSRLVTASACEFVLKVTGRYFCPHLTDHLRQVPRGTGMVSQHDSNYCEVVGASKTLMGTVFMFPAPHNHVEQHYHTRAIELNAYHLPLLTVDPPVKNGGSLTLKYQL